MGSLRRTRPENLDDLTIQVAIVRPGPIQGGAVNPYIERRQRLRVDPDYEVPYDHPSLEPVLRDTLGTIIFQDQVIEVAMAFAGFSPGEAEGLRRAMSRKRSAEAIEAHHRGFVEGAMAKWPDVDEALAERVWSMVVGFSGFGFPKAHGAAFGLLAYQSTWLRVHYGPEFLCALLDEQPMGFYPPDALVHEAQRRGIEILPPDVNASAVGCTVVDVPAAVLPFRPAPGARAGPRHRARRRADARAHAAARAHGRRARPRRRPPRPRLRPRRARRRGRRARRRARGRRALPLARRPRGARGRRAPGAGPAGVVGRLRRAWPAVAGRRCGAWAPRRRAHAAGAGGTQLSLGLELPAAPALAPLDDWDAMIADYATTGLTVDRHPLRLLRAGLTERGIVSSADLDDLPHGAQVRVGGIVVARQRPGTAKGVVFLLLEDETGTVNLIVPPQVYERDRLTVRTEPLVVVEGVLERFASAGGAINVLVRRLAPLDAPDLLSRRPRPRSRTSRCSTRASSRGSRSSSRAWPWRRPAARRPPTCARPHRRPPTLRGRRRQSPGRRPPDPPPASGRPPDRRRPGRADRAPRTAPDAGRPGRAAARGRHRRRGLPGRGPADHELRPGSAAMMGGRDMYVPARWSPR